jgi:hypothetical protein
VDEYVQVFLTSALLVNGQFRAPTVLPPEKEPHVRIEQEAGWAQNLSGRCGQERNLVHTRT